MSLKNLALKQNIDTVTLSGDNRDFTEDGISIPNGVHVAEGSPDYRTRRTITFKSRMSVYDAKAVDFNKEKKVITLVEPYVHPTTGKITFNTLRIEREMHPDCLISGSSSFNGLGAQMLVDSQLDAFWKSGSLS